MNLLQWFRRTRPTPPPTRISRVDICTAHAWGLTLDQWDSLTDFERAECRRNITTAPKFQEAS